MAPRKPRLSISWCRKACGRGVDLTVDFDGAGPVPPYLQSSGIHRAQRATDLEGYYEESQQWQSNEINLSSNGEGDVQWIVGLYQYSQNWDSRRTRVATR